MNRLTRLIVGTAMALALTASPVLAAHTYNGSEVYIRDELRDHRGWLSTTPYLSHDARDRVFEIRTEYLKTGKISHAGAFDETDGCWKVLGEVIGWTNGWGGDYIGSADWVLDAWHNSPSHEDVIHSSWTRFGVGATYYEGLRFYVVVFGKGC